MFEYLGALGFLYLFVRAWNIIKGVVLAVVFGVIFILAKLVEVYTDD